MSQDILFPPSFGPRIPLELFPIITAELSRKEHRRTLASLYACSKTMQSLVGPALYHTLTITNDNLIGLLHLKDDKQGSRLETPRTLKDRSLFGGKQRSYRLRPDPVRWGTKSGTVGVRVMCPRVGERPWTFSYRLQKRS
jgi:hypothetical protein